MPAVSTGADDLAKAILVKLLPDIASAPEIQVPAITNDQLTSGMVGGAGIFDVLMASVKAHLREEYDGNRISGAEYTKAYIGLTSAALTTAAQFLLGRDTAYLQNIAHKWNAETAEVNYALTTMKLSTEDAQYGLANAQKNMIGTQILGIEVDNLIKDYTRVNILPKQKDLLTEQTEVQRAQTANSRMVDGAVVTGVLGKQKDLYSQQIVSYQRDAETKAVKIWSDAWITQKTVDEGLLAPTNFTNTQLNEMLQKLRTNLGLQ